MTEDRSSDQGSMLGEDVSRRKLLKILAASGTAVAASAVLPGRWIKPVVNMGVLPAHAQQSGDFSIGNMSARRGSVYYDLSYNDPAFKVNADTTYLAVWNRGPSCNSSLVYNGTISKWGGSLSGTPGRGKITNATVGGSPCGACDVEARGQLFEGGRSSNRTAWFMVPDDPKCNVSAPN